MLVCVKMDAGHSLTSQLAMVNAITHRTGMNVYLRNSPHKYTSEDNKVTAGKCGAIEAVVSAMKTHLNNAVVCEKGCGALQIIAINGKCHHT